MALKFKLTESELSQLSSDLQSCYTKNADGDGYRLDLDDASVELAAVAGLKAKNAELLGKLKAAGDEKTALQQQIDEQSPLVADHQTLREQMRKALVTDKVDAFVNRYVPERLRSVVRPSLEKHFDLQKGENGEYASKIGYTRAATETEPEQFVNCTNDELWQHLKTDPALGGCMVQNFAAGATGALRNAETSQGEIGKPRNVQDRALEIVQNLNIDSNGG